MKAGRRYAEIALCAVLSLMLVGFFSPQVAFAKGHGGGRSVDLAPAKPSPDDFAQAPSVDLGGDGQADEPADNGGTPDGDGGQADEPSDSGGASEGDGEQRDQAPAEEKAPVKTKPVKTKVAVNNNASGGDLPLGAAAIIVFLILAAAVALVRRDELKKR